MLIKVQSMRGTFADSKYVSKAMLVRRWTARIVWGMQRQADAAQILATWRAHAFLIGHALNLRQLVAGGSWWESRGWRCCPPLLVLLVRVRESGFCWTIWIRFFYGCGGCAVYFVFSR